MNIRPRILILCVLILSGTVLLWMKDSRARMTHTSVPIRHTSSPKQAHPVQTPQHTAHASMQPSTVIRGTPSPQTEYPPLSTEEVLHSFTTLPASLRDPRIVAVIKKHREESSRIASILKPSAPYDPPELSEDPTDAEVAAYDRYDREYRDKGLETMADERRALEQSRLESAQTLAHLKESLGEATYADYVRWSTAESIAATLSWHLSKEDTRLAAEDVVKKVAEGHSVEQIFNEIETIRPLRGTEVVALLTARLRP